MRPIDIEKEYQEMLNDNYPVVDVAGYEFLAGDALAKLDPVALRCGAVDYADSMLQDGVWVEGDDGEYYWEGELEQEA